MPEELQKDISRVYQGLQHMQIEPSKTNLAILLDAMRTFGRLETVSFPPVP